MSKLSLTSSWISEFCAPVVVVVATAEVEALALKNGVLFHDLLRAFAHVDLNVSVKSCNQPISINEGFIRFERSTELLSKNPGTIEELLRSSFEEYDLAKLPANATELRADVPTAWTSRLEKIVTRSVSFSEWEMLSHPVVLMTVVATTDFDPLVCMQEMASYHHTPQCIATSGQYESDIYRVYVLVHDPHAAANVDPVAVQRKLQTQFPPSQTRLLVINSTPPGSPNLQQPDLWSRAACPLFYPQHAPAVPDDDADIKGKRVTSTSPQFDVRHPVNGSRVYGAYLSMDDFIALRDFCHQLYIQDIIPQMERRIANLNRVVKEARKGVANLFKSFIRNPRDEPPLSLGYTTGLKYKIDRIEAQILLLADSCFLIKDYDSALSHYKLVSDDFKAHRSMCHLAHTNLMSLLCYAMTESSRRNLAPQLESLGHVLREITDCPQAHACYSLLACDMYMNFTPIRMPIEAAQFLLNATAATAKLDLLSGLLTERAAALYLLAGFERKFILHQVLCGLRLRVCGTRPALHSIVVVACALLSQDDARWGGLRSKLYLLLARDVKDNMQSSRSQYLLMMLHALRSAIMDHSYVTGKITNMEIVAESVLADLSTVAAQYNNHVVSEGWDQSNVFEIIQNPYFVYEVESTSVSTKAIIPGSAAMLEVTGLPVPEVQIDSVVLMQPINGLQSRVQRGEMSPEFTLSEKLARLLSVEREWSLTCETSKLLPLPEETLWRKYVEIEFEDKLHGNHHLVKNELGPLRVPIGETVAVQLRLANRLSCGITLIDLCLDLPPTFEPRPVNLTIPAKSVVDIQLEAIPLLLGNFTIDSVRWDLIEGGLRVRQPVRKIGKLELKTRQQRASRQRAADVSLQVEVTPPCPLLHITLEGLSDEILHGQLVKTTIILHNEGTSPAFQVYIKQSRPVFTIYFLDQNSPSSTKCTPEELSEIFLRPIGQTGTIFRLPQDLVIQPGESRRIGAWLRLGCEGKQSVSLLATYMATGTLTSDKSASQGFGTKEGLPRTSFLRIQTTVLPSVRICASITPQCTSLTMQSIVVDVMNCSVPRKDRHRNTSRGLQDFETPNLDEHTGLEEGRVKIDCISIFGATMIRRKPERNDVDHIYHSKVASHGESLTLVFPLDSRLDGSIKESQASKSSTKTHKSRGEVFDQSWALKLPIIQGHSDNAESVLQDTQLEKLYILIENILCQNLSTDIQMKQLNEALRVALLGDDEGSAGPKSITQVRKERERLSHEIGNMSNSLEEIDIEDKKNESRIQSLISNNISFSSFGQPVSMNDVVQTLSRTRKLAVTVVWSTRWHGKVRTGLHYLLDIDPMPHSLVTEEVSLSSGRTPASQLVPLFGSSVVNPNLDREIIDRVAVALRHPRSSVLSSTGQAVHLNAVVEVWNTNNFSVYVTIEPNLQKHESSFDAPRMLTPQQNGFAWVGKTRHVGQLVKCGVRHSFQFVARICKPGVYDLHRFKIFIGTVESADETELVEKSWIGSSMIEVTGAE